MICGHVKLPFISVHIDDDEQKPVGHRGCNMDLYHLRTPEKKSRAGSIATKVQDVGSSKARLSSVQRFG
jgi:hypothetical protein